MTPQEWRDKTIKDLELRRQLKIEGKKQAKNYNFENMHKVQRRINK